MWQETADVVVIGFGAAGGAAAIVAHDAGAKVLILEKMAAPGGTTQLSNGRSRRVADPARAVAFFSTLCEGATPREVLEAFVYQGEELPAWLESLGGEIEDAPRDPGGHPGQVNLALPNADAVSDVGWRVRGGPSGGANLFGLLLRNVTQRGIRVRTETPVRRLLTNSQGAVVGVVAEQGGRPLHVQARRGVILACGGFTANPEMQRQYLGETFPSYASPGNTGDGVRMAAAVGADLWHMIGMSGSLSYRIPGLPAPIGHRMRAPGFVYLDQAGRRFMNETGVDSHHLWFHLSVWDPDTMSYPRVPAYVVFDDNTRRAGPVGLTAKGAAQAMHQWSTDNSDEIARGWITRSDSLAGLAAAMGLPADLVQETVARYNAACTRGRDPEFDRAAPTLVPIAGPPFYAAAIWPVLAATRGGARRNARAQIVDGEGQPIPGLYGAGEFGAVFHRLYPGFAAVQDALVFGRIAGRNAAAETPRD